MPVIAVATLTPIAEHRDAVLAAIQNAVPAVHAEQGCDLYALHQSKETFVIIEQWADGDALKAHGGSDVFVALTAALEDKLVTPMDVKILRPVPGGTAEQGQLV